MPINGVAVGKHLLVCCLLKGVFNLQPLEKILVPMWLVLTVIRMLKSWGPAKKLDFKSLTFKTVMLLALTRARRVSSLVLLSVESGFCEIGDLTQVSTCALGEAV